MPKISASIINYNSKQDLINCLDHLFIEAEDIDLEIWVVDNASEESINNLVESYPKVNFIINRKNTGFGAANNKVIRSTNSRYHLILNPDVVLSKGSLDKMTDFMDQNPDIGILVPKMVFENGDLQYSCRRFPTLASFLVRGFSPNANNGILNRYLLKDKSHDEVMDVDWGLGSCIMARRSFLDELGGFDEKYFMYYEDIDLCYRAKKAGWRVVYYPHAEIVHHYHRESAKRFVNKLTYLHTVSALRFFIKYLFERGRKTFM